ncbi:hypothetical protein C7S13_7014 [Burkholderia cepacia]|nr:hypothetical protein [Burkholderia cepacia]QOH37992.1 hypothetical protein C7S14_1244 [Burkholderia cepacia]
MFLCIPGAIPDGVLNCDAAQLTDPVLRIRCDSAAYRGDFR